MRCPVDNETLVMTERSGVEIDYCPKCRGVWLDRGELDKIIERGMATPGASAQPAVPPVAHHPAPQPAPYATQPSPQHAPSHVPRYYDPKKVYKRDDDDYYRYKKKRKESFLGELFDFD